MSTCQALVIPADQAQPARVETIGTDLETLQTLVHGSIEAVSGKDWHFYLNEEGKILALMPNVRAAALVWELTGALTDVYCGDVVFLGDDAQGEEADLPAHVIAIWEQTRIGQPTS
ncbi:DUF3846 domain-containing protein [Arthrobacter sp. MP_2.3]|uniref:DUF3846 domain-containing protein n=1 Tax=Arthrobacter sp. MP_2.3 TaxID=3349633 RepID=UPI0038D50EE0